MRRALAGLSLRLARPERVRHFRELQRSQWLPLERLAEHQNAKLTKLLRHAAATVPFYRRVVADLGLRADTLGPEALVALPLVDKPIMGGARDDFVSTTVAADRRLPNTTGGSTGAWFEFFIDRDANEIRHAADMRGRAWAGWRVGDRQAMLWGHRRDVAASAEPGSRLRNTLLNRTITLNAYDMDEAAVLAFHDRILAYRPRLVIGYATALAYFADFVERRALPMPRPAGCISSAETLTDDQRAIIERVFGCPLLNRYGSREFSTVAQQCGPGSPLHLSAERTVVEIVDEQGRPCPAGQRGEIVVTDLDNFVMPFIRYRTGDLGVLGTDACACGRGLPVLASIEGRVSELIVGLNGKLYSCQSPRLFGADIPGIRQMQVVQDSLESILVRIAPGPEWSPESRRLVVERMRGLLGDVTVDVETVDAIPVSPSGKYRFTISSVSPFARRVSAP
jgi:phenylacetate-CoA ligase